MTDASLHAGARGGEDARQAARSPAGESVTVGAALHRARRARNIGHAEVTRRTKIQPWVLDALESDQLQDLMSPIYVKGFLTTYAKFLGLEPEPLLARFPWPAPEPFPASLPPVTPIARWTFPWPRVASRRLALTTFAAAALVILSPLRRFPQRVSLKSASPKLASVAVTVSEPLKPPAPPTLTVLASQPLELGVTAKRTTWVQVRADGKLLTQQRLPRGAHEAWSAKRRFELVFSHPTQVDVTLNGQPISSFAIAHQGRLLITHHGIAKLPDSAE